jgi:hypothetical protein
MHYNGPPGQAHDKFGRGKKKKKPLLTTWIFFSIFVHQNSHVAEKDKKVRATDLTESHSHP